MSSNQPPPSPVAALHAPLQQLTLNEWDRWGLEIPALIEIRSPADLHQWLNAATPDHAATLLAGFARLAASDDLALAALAWLLTGVLTIASTQQDPHNFLDRAESTLRTIPWDTASHIPTYVLTQLTGTAIAEPAVDAVPYLSGRPGAWEQLLLF
jgi:hypothetical protein